jgi:hypothetical protein
MWSSNQLLACLRHKWKRGDQEMRICEGNSLDLKQQFHHRHVFVRNEITECSDQKEWSRDAERWLHCRYAKWEGQKRRNTAIFLREMNRPERSSGEGPRAGRKRFAHACMCNCARVAPAGVALIACLPASNSSCYAYASTGGWTVWSRSSSGHPHLTQQPAPAGRARRLTPKPSGKACALPVNPWCFGEHDGGPWPWWRHAGRALQRGMCAAWRGKRRPAARYTRSETKILYLGVSKS